MTEEQPDTFPVPMDLMDCLALFIHQIEINDYVSVDQQHDLKMNAYWPAIHGLYVSIVQSGFSFNDQDRIDRVAKLNKDREHLLPPRFIPSNDQEKRFKDWIDTQSYQGLLQRWRFAPSGGDPIFMGEIGKYYSAMLAYRRDMEPDGGVRASKAVGWD